MYAHVACMTLPSCLRLDVVCTAPPPRGQFRRVNSTHDEGVHCILYCCCTAAQVLWHQGTVAATILEARTPMMGVGVVVVGGRSRTDICSSACVHIPALALGFPRSSPSLPFLYPWQMHVRTGARSGAVCGMHPPTPDADADLSPLSGDEVGCNGVSRPVSSSYLLPLIPPYHPYRSSTVVQ